jgi:hypothetical protein
MFKYKYLLNLICEIYGRVWSEIKSGELETAALVLGRIVGNGGGGVTLAPQDIQLQIGFLINARSAPVMPYCSGLLCGKTYDFIRQFLIKADKTGELSSAPPYCTEK